MTFTPREIRKHSKTQYKTAKWVAERLVYMCKIFSEEVREASKIIQNQKEVFEKEHKEVDYKLRLDTTMSEMADKLKLVKMKDLEIVPNEGGEITTYHLKISPEHILSHLGIALNGGCHFYNHWIPLRDGFCTRIALSMQDYFEQYNLTLVFKFDCTKNLSFIDVRTNGLIPSDF